MTGHTEVPVNPGELVRQFRQNYVNAHAMKKVAPTALQGAKLSTPKEKPITEGDLPQALRSLLQEYKQSHPKSKITLLKYQRLDNGKPTVIVEDETGLPDEGQLLSLSQTVTLTTNTDVRAITEIFVAGVETA